MVKSRIPYLILFSILSLVIVSCAPTARVTSGGGPTIGQAQAESYSGPKARIAVSRFKDKTAKGYYSGKIGVGMVDMLTTALFNTNRFIVLERQTVQDVLAEQDLGASGRIQPGTEAPIGKIEGAELLVVGAVTEFEPHSAGGGAGLGGIIGGGPFGAITAAFKKAHIAIDLRIVDAKTSRILAATSVEGSATDVGGMFGILGGSVGGGLGGYQNTPTEKAIRVCLKEAVNWITSQTPAQYYRH
ncbi:MAG: CsgG/HfaB family protein [Deltaproteobacteria bacterium]|nr:CsgG/HfaB family protein [Deltaproteobacteria bacterium]